MMRKHSSILFVAFLISGLGLYGDSAFAQLKAFPEAEGFGAFVTGGRGGSIYHVTSLADSGAGTLRDAISQSNRIIVFDVCGVINVSSALAMSNNITIAGETAPGDGITIYGNELSGSNRNNIIVRDIRIRSGMNSSSTTKALNVTTGHDMIFDHLSIEWARYDNFGFTSNSYNITLQNSISGEPINQQFSGGFVDSSTSITLSHNLWLDAKTRNPKIKGNLQYINNVVYNWGATEGLSGGHSSANWYEDVINNYFISGPSSSSTIAGEFSSTDMVYNSGNMKDTNKNGVLDGTAMLTSDFSGGPTFQTAPYCNPTVAVTTDSATVAYNKVIAGSGALVRDPVDTRLINQVTSLGTSGLVLTGTQDESTVGGQPTMTVVTRPAGFDTDGDGMPDTWETAHGLNPSNAADRNLTNPLGYTMVEQYINELGANHATPTWNGNSGNWLTPTYWSTGAIPTNNDNAYVVGNGTGTNVLMTVTGTMAQCFSLHIGGNSGPSGDKVSVNGTLAVTDTIYVGDQNNGTLEINGGTTQAWNVQLGNTVGGTTYTGNLSLNGGTLKTCEVVLGGGTPGNWTSGGSCTWSGGTVQAIGALKFAVPATIGAGGAKIDSNGFACTVSGVLSGTGGLTKLGSGTLVLTAANTYTGNTIVSAGTLQLASGARLSSATAVNLSASGATLDMNGNSQTIASLTGVSGSALMLGGSALTVGGDATTTFSGAITSTGAGTLTKAGSGTLTLSASNAFTGAVNFNGGLINAASLNNLGSGSALNFNGGGLQFAAVYDPSARTMTFQSGGATLDTNGKNIVLANPIGNGGAGGLTKAGSGTLTLNAANTYTGDTIISGGTLELAPTGQIATASDINTSATTATLQIDSGTYTVGNISGVGNTILSAGGNLTVSSVVQNTLTIGDGATLTIAPIPGGPTAGMDLPVPVPEPSSIILLIAAAAGILFFVKKT